ncbi:MAG: nucleoside deaminase [Oscillospiraceae bacterium]|nr:nucleoside deaminase [Oscillospiraceae bacterium]
MTYTALSPVWQRIFELSFASLCEGSRAIAAVITDSEGRILSEGRNRCAASPVPNARTAHAETEAVIGLDTARFPDLHSYTLHTGLEPCVMCMGTLVMGGIRHIEMAASDEYSGAAGLLQHMEFLRQKQITITRTDPVLGEMQRGFQTVRELLYNEDAERLQRILEDFCVRNRRGTLAARDLVRESALTPERLSGMDAQTLFDSLAQRIEADPLTP